VSVAKPSSPQRFLLQLAGPPGIGKSTLARGIARVADAHVIDRDVIKSALLEGGVDWGDAGRLSFDVMFALAADALLEPQARVILDTTSHYPSVPERAAAIAHDADIPFLFIECLLRDLAQLEQRLMSRTRRASQTDLFDETPRGSTAEKIGIHLWRTYGPPEGWPVLDMSPSRQECVEQARRLLEIKARKPTR
jgi:predicted kinase